MKTLIFLLNLIHLFFIFLPILIYFIKKSFIKPFVKWILLISIMIPLHWVFLDNRCIFTVVSQKAGDMKNSETTSPFSEKYLKWLYKPIMNIIGWEWNNEGLDKIITLNWIINILLCWYYCFYIV